MVEALEKLQKDIHGMAVSKGWWPPEQNSWEREAGLPEKLCLIHSEISEALEEFRAGYPVRETRFVDGKPEGVGVELADAVIRIFDLCGGLGIDLAGCIEQKMRYNATRPHRHGGKRA